MKLTPERREVYAEQQRSCLVLDATADRLLVGLFGAGNCEERSDDRPRQAFSQLIPLVKELVHRSGPPDWIFCNRGPGSFTGTRLTVSAARNLGQLWEIPVFGIDALLLLGHFCRKRLHAGEGDTDFAVLLDGKQERYYTRLFRRGRTLDEYEKEPVEELSFEEFQKRCPPGTILYTDDISLAQRPATDRIRAIHPIDTAKGGQTEEIRPAALYACGLELGGKERARDWSELFPCYVRPDPAKARYPEGFHRK